MTTFSGRKMNLNCKFLALIDDIFFLQIMDFFSKYCQKGLQRIQSFFAFTICKCSLYWVQLSADSVFFKIGCQIWWDLTKIMAIFLLRDVLNQFTKKTLMCPYESPCMKPLNSCPQHKTKQDRKFRRRKMMRSENSMRRKTAIKNCRQV